MDTQALWFGAAFAMLCFGIALSFVVRAVIAEKGHGSGASNRISSEYYKPMGRLLAEEEFRRVTTAGFTARQVKQLRASRCRVFRHYLIELQGDFRALHKEARICLRDSSTDRPDLAIELMRQFAAFHYQVAVTHCLLSADSLGLRPASVDKVLEPVRWMSQQVELLRTPTSITAV